MAENKEQKKSAHGEFKQKILDRANINAATLGEGLKSPNAKVRALAAKISLRTQDKAFIKKSVLPLIASDKSKKVLRVISKRVTRKPLLKKLAELKVKKTAKAADAAPEAAEKAPAAKA